jgi:lipid-binding SYLF domain-containing protein
MEVATMNFYRSLLIAGISASALFFAAPALAESSAEIDAGVQAALADFYAVHAEHRELADKAAAILVFPHVTRAGVGVGGSYGEGALLVHGRTVGYYKIGSASVGVTLGVEKHSEVIMFMTDAARDKFLKSNGWTIGADAEVAVASASAAGQYDTATMHRAVLGFVFGEKGLMADVSLEGSKITKIRV